MIEPLGDQGVLCRCTDEAEALRLAALIRAAAPSWLLDVVSAYVSVALFIDRESADVSTAMNWLRSLDAAPTAAVFVSERSVTIPCCYELGPDLAVVAAAVGLTVDQVVQQHSETEYTVYAIGFCPGFPYLGYLPPMLCGVPRLPTPRVRVAAGSVGLTGRQTGIYSMERPGGWPIIGLTPLRLVDVAEEYFPLQTGDRVRFEPIDRTTYQRLLGRRL